MRVQMHVKQQITINYENTFHRTVIERFNVRSMHEWIVLYTKFHSKMYNTILNVNFYTPIKS